MLISRQGRGKAMRLRASRFALPCSEREFLDWALAQPGAAFLDSSDGSGASSLRFSPTLIHRLDQPSPWHAPNTQDLYTLPPCLLDLQSCLALTPTLSNSDQVDALAHGPQGPGWVIFASYEVGYLIEPSLGQPQSDGDSFPLLHAAFHYWSLIRDAQGKWLLASLEDPCLPSHDDLLASLSAMYELPELSAQALPQAWQPFLAGRAGRELQALKSMPASSACTATLTRAEYARAFDRTLAAIHDGDCYIANLTQRFEVEANAENQGSPVALYHHLRELSPAPYAAYWDFGTGHALLSSSPECFMRVDGQAIETMPIKGTRPVSADPAINAARIADMQASEKERAELTMIVDLERNDLGRVAERASVRVPKIHALQSYRHVHHMIAVIEAKLRADTDLAHLLQAVFPGGSITGAPKVSTMRLLRQIEPTRRGGYTGSIFALGLDGSLISNILIRTIFAGPEGLSFNTGGGIVFDSQCASEYRECFHKARGIKMALKAWALASHRPELTP